MDPAISLINPGSMNFDIIHGQEEEEEAMEEALRKQAELKDAINNGFDDLIDSSDDEDDEDSDEDSRYFKPPHLHFGIHDNATTSTPKNAEIHQNEGLFPLTTQVQNPHSAPSENGHYGPTSTPNAFFELVNDVQQRLAQKSPSTSHSTEENKSNGHAEVDHFGPHYDNSHNHISMDLQKELVQYSGSAEDRPGSGDATHQDEFWQPDPEPSDQYVQLQVLYKARVREVERLTSELDHLKESSREESAALKAQIVMTNGERETLIFNLNQAHKVIQDKISEISELTVKVTTLENQVEIESSKHNESSQKLEVAESTIKMLQEQVSDLSNSDSLSRIKKECNNMLTNLKEKHKKELLDYQINVAKLSQELSTKTKEMTYLKNQLEEQQKTFEMKLCQKSESINQLSQTLDASQKQCKSLLENGSTEETRRLLSKIHSLEEERMSECKKIHSLQSELSHLQSVLQSPAYQESGSYLQQIARHSSASPSDTNSKLKLDLEETLLNLKSCRQDVTRLQMQLISTQKELIEKNNESEAMEQRIKLSERELVKLQERLQTRDNSETESQFQDARVEDLMKQIKNLKEEIKTNTQQRERLEEENEKLQKEKEELLTSFADDKRVALEQCKDSILELHYSAMQRLREELLSLSQAEKDQLIQSYEERLSELRSEYESLQKTIDNVKDLYIRACEEKNQMEAQLKDIKDGNEHDQETIESKLRKEFEEIILKIKPVWENDLVKKIESQLDDEMKIIQAEWLAEKQEEIKKAVYLAETKTKELCVAEYKKELESLQAGLIIENAELKNRIKSCEESEKVLQEKNKRVLKKLQHVERKYQDEKASIEKAYLSKVKDLQLQLEGHSIKPETREVGVMAKARVENVDCQVGFNDADIKRMKQSYLKALERIDHEIKAYIEQTERNAKRNEKRMLVDYHHFLLKKLFPMEEIPNRQKPVSSIPKNAIKPDSHDNGVTRPKKSVSESNAQFTVSEKVEGFPDSSLRRTRNTVQEQSSEKMSRLFSEEFAKEIASKILEKSKQKDDDDLDQSMTSDRSVFLVPPPVRVPNIDSHKKILRTDSRKSSV